MEAKPVTGVVCRTVYGGLQCAFLPLAVSNGLEAHWIFSLVDSSSPFTYISREVSAREHLEEYSIPLTCPVG